VWNFIVDRKAQILINALNHAYLVILCVIFATVIAIALATASLLVCLWLVWRWHRRQNAS